MKTQILLILLIFVSTTILAQTDLLNELTEPSAEAIAEPVDTTYDTASDTIQEAEFIKPENSDTVHIRIGNHALEIISEDKKTHIDVDKIEDYQSHWDKFDRPHIRTVHHRNNKKFNGHWAGIDFGGNLLWNTTYPTNLYPEGTPNFLKTAPEKSFEVNLNLFEYSFGFCSYVGLVTGLGLNFNDYKFKERYTLTKDENGIIQPLEMPEGNFRLSKLSTTYITAPLLLEFQIPGQWDHNRMFITAGVIGGVKIHEHVKTKIGDEKTRDNGDHNISSLRWGYIARIGFDNFGIYATYYNTKLFESGLGPSTTPASIGICLLF